MSKDLDEYRMELYRIASQMLYNRMDSLTYEEASSMLKELWRLIPVTYEVNPVALMGKFKETFKDHPKINEHFVTYEIKIDPDVHHEDLKWWQKLIGAFKNRRY